MESPHAPFAILTHYIKSVSFENTPPFFYPDEANPNIRVNIQVKGGPLSEGFFEVILDITVSGEGDAKDNPPPVTYFDFKLSYGSCVRVDEAMSHDLNRILMVDVPFLMFPFARNIAADLTRESGYPPIFLAPVDFNELYARHQKEMN